MGGVVKRQNRENKKCLFARPKKKKKELRTLRVPSPLGGGKINTKKPVFVVAPVEKESQEGRRMVETLTYPARGGRGRLECSAWEVLSSSLVDGRKGKNDAFPGKGGRRKKK